MPTELNGKDFVSWKYSNADQQKTIHLNEVNMTITFTMQQKIFACTVLVLNFCCIESILKSNSWIHKNKLLNDHINLPCLRYFILLLLLILYKRLYAVSYDQNKTIKMRKIAFALRKYVRLTHVRTHRPHSLKIEHKKKKTKT